MDSSNSSTEFRAEGNTKPPPKQISPSKMWCFTWNNYGDDYEVQIVQAFKVYDWIVG